MPEPSQTLTTRWEDEPFSRGVYSHVAVGASSADYDVMAEPLWEERLLFAGEATCREHPATVAGAFISGMREAGRVSCRLHREARARIPAVALAPAAPAAPPAAPLATAVPVPAATAATAASAETAATTAPAAPAAPAAAPVAEQVRGS